MCGCCPCPLHVRVLVGVQALSKCRADLTASTAELARCQTRMLELVKAVGSYRGQLEAANDVIASLQAQLAATAPAAPTVPVGELASLRDQLAVASRERDEAKAEVRRLEGLLAGVQFELSDAKSKAAGAATEASRLAQLLQGVEEQQKAAVAEHDQVGGWVDSAVTVGLTACVSRRL